MQGLGARKERQTYRIRNTRPSVLVVDGTRRKRWPPTRHLPNCSDSDDDR